jgi:hypothetical protein
MMDNQHPDTNMLYQYQLMPVSHLNFSGVWATETLFAQLRARDTWAITGGPTSQIRDAGEKLEQLARVMDDAERADERKEREGLKDKFYHMGRDAWRSMQARIGTRNKRASDYHGVARSTPVKTQQAPVTLTDAS